MHSGAPLMHYFPHGHVWSRALYQKASLQAGGVLRQKNAYLFGRYPEQGGAEMVEQLRRRLVNPLVATEADLPAGLRADETPGALARPGEAGDSPIDKRRIWDALRDCRDDQLYTARPSVVDLGLIYDVRVRGDTVYVLMTMPHRGRPRYGYFAWGSGGNSQPIRQRLLQVPGVRKVVIEHTWEPAWDTNRITETGRQALGLPRQDIGRARDRQD
jgi:metal-sulfur cluster biosynthetic enzyme